LHAQFSVNLYFQELVQQLSLSTRKCYDEDNFTLPSWSEFQAYQLGIQKAYNKLLTLIPDQGE
jgi:hypothetical protein